MTHEERMKALVEAGDKATQGEWKAGRADMISYHGFDDTPFKNVYGPEREPHPNIPGKTVPVVVAEAQGDDCMENAPFIACAANARDTIALAAEIVGAAGEYTRSLPMENLLRLMDLLAKWNGKVEKP